MRKFWQVQCNMGPSSNQWWILVQRSGRIRVRQPGRASLKRIIRLFELDTRMPCTSDATDVLWEGWA